MALSRYVEKKFGVKTRAYPIADPVSCLTTVTVILPNNPDRLGYLLVNLGDTAMYVAWDRGVLASHGVYIGKGGGSFSLAADEDGELVGYELFGISVDSANDIFTMVTEAEPG